MDGGKGAVRLTPTAIRAHGKPSEFNFLYLRGWPIKEKTGTFVTQIYGAEGVEYSPEAQKIELYTKLGFDKQPMDTAKTHLSLSRDPALKGVPKGYKEPARGIRASAGAGFLYPLCGEMRTMPGPPTRPVFYDVDPDVETGRVLSLC